MKRYYTTAADGRVFEHPDGPFVLWAEHEAEVAAVRAELARVQQSHDYWDKKHDALKARIATLEAALAKALSAFETIGYHLPKDNIAAINEAICIARGFQADYDGAPAPEAK
jgi:hypothetical protein